MKGHLSTDSCRHSVGRGPVGYQRNFSGSSSKVSQTSTGATTARSAKQLIQIAILIICTKLSLYFRVQSATRRELDEDDSIESLKGKNQKVSRNRIQRRFRKHLVQVSEILGKIEEISKETKDLAGSSRDVRPAMATAKFQPVMQRKQRGRMKKLVILKLIHMYR